MGTPEFAVPGLSAVIAGRWEIKAVVTQPDKPAGRHLDIEPTPVRKFALSAGIPVLQPENFSEPGFRNRISALKPDLIVVVAFGVILPGWVLELPSMGCINLHPSLLPKYRGPAPVPWAILNGEKKTGVTTIFVTGKVDAGDIILQREVEIDSADTSESLSHRLSEAGSVLLAETIAAFEKGHVKGKPQDEKQATWTRQITKEDGRIDWTKPAEEIHNQVRAMQPWPGAFTSAGSKLIKICRTKMAHSGSDSGRPGEIIAYLRDGCLVKTGKGCLVINEVHPAGRRRMGILEYCRGNALEKGMVLGIK